MVYCSAPFCKSERGKVVNISFHEFPVDPELRGQWIENVSRKDWSPTDRSVICSAHFRDEDYKSGMKKRRLKPGAIPTVFHAFPKYLQRSILKKSGSIPKRKAPTERSRATPKTRKRRKSNENNNEENHFIEISANSEPALNIQGETLDSISPSPAVKQNPCKVARPFNSPITVRNSNVQRSTEIRLKTEVEELRQELNQMKAREKKLEEKLDKLTRLEDDAMKGDRSSLFLNDQINAYGNQRTKWTEAIIRESIVFRAESPEGYEYARKRRLLKLPSPSTLKRYMGVSTGEPGFTSLVRQRLHMECARLTQVETYGSLVSDEMVIEPDTKNEPHFDRIVGQVDPRDVGVRKEPANSLLCFVFKGLSKRIRIPVLYYLTRQLTARELKPLFLKTIRVVEEAGFRVIELICDNSSVNTSAYKLLCESADLKPDIPHPEDPERTLYLSLD